jgi:hypothetical protein
MGGIKGRLIVRIRVNRRHQAALESEGFMDDFDDRGKTVRCA